MAGLRLQIPNPALTRFDNSAGLVVLSALFLPALATLSTLTATLLLATALLATALVWCAALLSLLLTPLLAAARFGLVLESTLLTILIGIVALLAAALLAPLATLAALSTAGLTATLLLSTTLSLTTFVLVVWQCRNSCRYPAKPDNINRGYLFRNCFDVGKHQCLSYGEGWGG